MFAGFAMAKGRQYMEYKRVFALLGPQVRKKGEKGVKTIREDRAGGYLGRRYLRLTLIPKQRTEYT
jgi:hypothetical protein